MTTSEKFCLQWNDFQENVTHSFKILREEPEFSDITLVCEENIQVKAHRVILSSSSPFFNTVLKKNTHSHPMIYMRGLKSKDLTAMMDFIYHGEVNIYQDDINDFLSLAEELQLKGLTGPKDENLEEKINNMPYNSTQVTKNESLPDKAMTPSPYKDETIKEMADEFTERTWNNQSIFPGDSNKIMVSYDTTNEDLKEKLSSMMEYMGDGNNKWKCLVCGKVSRDRTDMGRHVECHLEGVSYPCNQCGKVSRSRNALRVHVDSKHRH